MSSGWICPRCDRSWAPHVDACRGCEPGAKAVTAGVAPPKAVPLIAELWEQWIPFASKRASWPVCLSQAAAFRRVKFKMDDGRETTIFELPWTEANPHTANLYRAVRILEPTGRRTKDNALKYVSDSTVNRELATLQSMLSYHRDVRKTIPYNPIDSFLRTDEAQNARQTSLSPEQVAAWVEQAHPLYADICMVMFRACGMRSSEARELQKNEIDWQQGVINLPAARTKKRRARVIPFPVDLEPILRRHCDYSRGPSVFVDPRDPKRMRTVSRDFLKYHMRRARKLSGLTGVNDEPIVNHHIRGSAVTLLAEMGAPDTFTMKAAGMSPKTLQRYTKFNRPQQDVLRGFLNRLVTPPTPITSELQGERRPSAAARPQRERPRLKSVESTGDK